MSDQENRNPQPSDSQKPSSDQRTGNQPNPPVQQNVPTGQPKSPQPEQEKRDEANKKQA
jgi:hypothetical protein